MYDLLSVSAWSTHVFYMPVFLGSHKNFLGHLKGILK